MQFFDMFKHILALECSFTTGFCRFGVQRTFPTDQTFKGFWVRGGGILGGGVTRIGGLEFTKTRILHSLEASSAWKPCKLRVLLASGLLECDFTTCLSTCCPWNAILQQVFADSASKEPSRPTKHLRVFGCGEGGFLGEGLPGLEDWSSRKHVFYTVGRLPRLGNLANYVFCWLRACWSAILRRV